jgi:N-acetylglucosaminyldiphosphoundecaprenol N-acetyl-beta-D-mannosaminyltransferase
MPQNEITIFDVRIDQGTQISEVITQCVLDKEHYSRITTLNPEILLLARSNRTYKETLNTATFNIVDGYGIVLVLKLCGVQATRLAGVDLMHDILEMINYHQGSVYLAVSAQGLSSWIEVKNALEARYPKIDFYGDDMDPKAHHKFIDKISCDVVLCNFGAPEQESFLASLSKNHASIGIGVGGAFDYVTGAVQRAPDWMCSAGLEWAYRLYQQPHRFMRIVRAVIVFPLLAILNVNKINK